MSGTGTGGTGQGGMDRAETGLERHHADTAPGDARPDEFGTTGASAGVYLAGFALAVLLTAASFIVAHTSLVWRPSIPIALSVLAVSQMGAHLVFFLHVSSGPDGTNNTLALAFGVLIVALVFCGSLWIMGHLNHDMLPMQRVMSMQR